MPIENVYVGGFNIGVSPSDVKIILTSSEPVFTDGAVTDMEVTEIGRLTLSLPLAKQLNQRLSMMLGEFEKLYGPIIDLDAEINNAE